MATVEAKTNKKPAAPKNEFLEKYKALGKNVEALLYVYNLAAIKDMSKLYVNSPYTVRDNYDQYIKNYTSISTTSKIGKVEKEAGMMIGAIFDGLLNEVRGLDKLETAKVIDAVRVTDGEDAEIKAKYSSDVYPSELKRLLLVKRVDALGSLFDDTETPNGLHWSRLMVSMVSQVKLSPTVKVAADHKEYFRKTLDRVFGTDVNPAVVGAVYTLFDGFLRALSQQLCPLVFHGDTNITKNLVLGVMSQHHPLTDDYINDLTDTLKQIADVTPKKPTAPKKKKPAASNDAKPAASGDAKPAASSNAKPSADANPSSDDKTQSTN